MNQFINSVKLNSEACRGCINCLKECPTQAIRVHGGKARIMEQFCIDCGKCIRVCPHHATYTKADKLCILREHKYNVALPTAALYGQFNNLTDPDIVLNALLDTNSHCFNKDEEYHVINKYLPKRSVTECPDFEETIDACCNKCEQHYGQRS